MALVVAMWRRRLVGAAALLLLVAGVVVAWSTGSVACGHVPIRVRGVVVDAKTGAPVKGAALLTLREQGDVATWAQIARDAEKATAPPLWPVGSATTDATGAFEAVVGLSFSYSTNWLGIVTGRSQQTPFEAVRMLLVEREGFERLVHDTKDASWVETAEGEIVGTLEVGTIRLEPRKKRTLKVRLVDGQGNPATVVGQMVWWAELPDAEYGTPVGAEGGVAVLKDLPATPVVLVALPSGFVVPSEGWPRRIVPEGVAETDLVLDVGASRTLRILGWDASGSGLVYLAAVGDLEPSQHSVEDDGTVQLQGLRPGVRYNLYIRHYDSGRCALFRGLPADEPWPGIELAAGRDLTGRVVLPDGCEGASVAVLVDKAALIDGTTEEDGTFRIPAVPEGPWTVVAYTTLGDTYLAATAEARAHTPVTLDLTKPRK